MNLQYKSKKLFCQAGHDDIGEFYVLDNRLFPIDKKIKIF